MVIGAEDERLIPGWLMALSSDWTNNAEGNCKREHFPLPLPPKLTQFATPNTNIFDRVNSP